MSRCPHIALILSLTAVGGLAYADEGTIRGRVTYRGEVPARPKLTVDVNVDVCGAHGDVLGEDLIVGRDAGLAHAVVFLVGVTPTTTRGARAARPAPGKLDQRGCVFLPHVQSLTQGAELVIGNDDPVVHNVHARVEGNTVFNLGMPLAGVYVKRKLKVPGVTVLSCDSGHHWMNAYVVVVPHPFHATSGADGEFRIEGVPPGSYVLRAWHERQGVVDVPVTVEAGVEREVVVDMPVARGRVQAAPVIDFARAVDAQASAPSDVGTPSSPGSGAVETPTIPTALPTDVLTTADAAALALDIRRALREADIARGRASYGRHCASCHGDRGDGRGEASRSMRSRPRAFTRGELEFRSTLSGEPALEEDIIRTITVGLPGTEMPGWGDVLPPSERRALARYVMSFSPRFVREAPPTPITIGPEPPSDAGSIERGKVLWARFRCAQCHGEDGRADGVSKRLVDDWGEPIAAADLRRGVYKSGPGGRDLYRTLVTGLSGTPMPAFVDLIGPTETWDLVHYVQSLADRPGFFERVLGLERR